MISYDIELKTTITFFMISVLVPGLIVLLPALITNQKLVKTISYGTFAALLLAFLFFLLTISKNRITKDSKEIYIKAAFYNIKIPNENVDDIFILKSEKLGSYAPNLRINGIGLPSYKSGWFEDVEGRKSFLLLVDGYAEVTVLKLHDYQVLISGNLLDFLSSSNIGDE
ncbi:PH domain-containing protein [Aestuariibacter sp. AA17]|uniref:PH domain-containing protein n=1 Tax=Fluctibacter corallii TaxID=2984329 RepID=A0ABT3ACA4_9ALTE|nr:PH domain-containing protein [Aestuariibacter sp. AA17]MCV2886250.1 PH domain-containing protein [Aestuariibacter sp. AA17]